MNRREAIIERDGKLPHRGSPINGVAPGYVATDMTADVTDEARERLTAAAALKRFGQPEEIAELVHFLLSERSSFTTGQTHIADGGTKFVP